jgi:hypothetical protein
VPARRHIVKNLFISKLSPISLASLSPGIYSDKTEMLLREVDSKDLKRMELVQSRCHWRDMLLLALSRRDLLPENKAVN